MLKLNSLRTRFVGALLSLMLVLPSAGCATCATCGGAATKQSKPGEQSTAVRAVDFREHVAVLADDRMEGRGVGTPGIEMAAAYIAGEFAKMGIEPGGSDGSYFQTFEMTTGAELGDDGEFALMGVDLAPTLGEGYTPFSFSSDDAFEGEIVFVGYGIVNEEKDHDDFGDLDLTGKVALLLRHEPPSWGDGDFTRHSQFRNKVYNAKDRGAVAVLVVNRMEGDRDRLMRFGRFGGGRGNYGLPAFHVKQEIAEEMLRIGGLATLESLQSELDEGGFVSKPLSGVSVRGRAGIEYTKATVRNVIGKIPGEGPLADEYVVIGGHYDHLGHTVSMMSMFSGDRNASREPQIHNGADDNASGIAGVIESGRVLMAHRPLKRSVLLMAYTGEESGLIGSAHYVGEPTVPLENIVAMLNMDMIGRYNEEASLQVFGTKAADEFDEMITRLCKERSLEVRKSASAVGPSDHTSFYRHKIPAMHFFTGLHEDYHRPGDDTEKVNFEGGAKVTDVVVASAMEIINADARPTYHEVTERARIGRGQSGDSGRPRVVMGVMPGYVDEGQSEGMPIDGVTPGGPAQDAGLKGGDQIVKIGDSDIGGIYDYMGALRGMKPGDVVDVKVLRDEQEMTFKVKLGGR